MTKKEIDLIMERVQDFTPRRWHWAVLHPITPKEDGHLIGVQLDEIDKGVERNDEWGEQTEENRRGRRIVHSWLAFTCIRYTEPEELRDGYRIAKYYRQHFVSAEQIVDQFEVEDEDAAKFVVEAFKVVDPNGHAERMDNDSEYEAKIELIEKYLEDLVNSGLAQKWDVIIRSGGDNETVSYYRPLGKAFPMTNVIPISRGPGPSTISCMCSAARVLVTPNGIQPNLTCVSVTHSHCCPVHPCYERCPGDGCKYCSPYEYAD